MPFKIQASADHDMEKWPLGQTTLTPNDTTVVILKAVWEYPKETALRMTVSNMLVSPDQALETSFILSTGED